MSILESFFRWIVEVSWQASILAIAVLAIQWVFRPWINPRWRHALWLLVLIRLVLPIVPESSISGHAWIPAPIELFTPEGPVLPSSVAEIAPNYLESIRRSPSPTPLTTFQIMAFLWLGGAVLGLSIVIGVNAAFYQHLRRLPPIRDPRLQGIFQKALLELGIKTPPSLLVTNRVSSPVLMGFFRPAILLPDHELQNYSDSELRLILLHELAHLKRGDLLIQWMLSLMKILHWFNPVLWFAFRRIRIDREPATDAFVLSHSGEQFKESYGLALLKVLENHQKRHALPSMVGILEDKSELQSRFRLISLFNQKAYAWSFLSILLIALLALFFLTREKRDQLGALVPDWDEKVLQASRKGDGQGILNLVLRSFDSPIPLSEEQVAVMLNNLAGKRDFSTFHTLLIQMRMTNLGTNWQPDDVLLSGLVHDGRRDFLEALMLETASPLNLKRLESLQTQANPEMADWISKRIIEIRKQKAEESALAEAALKGDIKSMQQLIDQGVDVNCVTKNHHTPLTNAAREGHAEAARLLLRHGAKVDQPKHPGWDYTPLCLAKTVAVAEVLKEHGANVHAKLFKRDVSILTYVSRWASPDLVQWFLDQGVNPKMIGDNNQTLLFNSGNGETTRILLNAGLDPNHVDEFGRTPITHAQDALSVQLLIARGARLTGLKNPLLPQMIQMGKVGAIEALLQAGGKHDHDTIQKALLSAAHSDKADIAKLLLKYGADPNEETGYPGPHKLSPLSACTIWGSPKTAKVLLDAGADPNGGKNPGGYLKNAMANGEVEVAKILKAAGARGVSDLAFSIAVRDSEKTTKLLSSAPVFSKDSDFWNGALVEASRLGDLKTVKACLDKGVPIKGKNGMETDPFAAAAGEGYHEILELLLAGLGESDDRSFLKTALWEAVWNSNPCPEQRSIEHFEKTIKLLIEKGAPVKTSDDDTMVITAVFTRYPNGNPRVIKMLVDAGANPNPLIKDREGKIHGHLVETIQKSCEDKNCSTPSATTLAAIEKATGHKFTFSKK